MLYKLSLAKLGRMVYDLISRGWGWGAARMQGAGRDPDSHWDHVVSQRCR